MVKTNHIVRILHNMYINTDIITYTVKDKTEFENVNNCDIFV